MAGRPQHAYPALDGMRGIAALAVVFNHFPLAAQPALFRNGLLAVDIFFVMSGFVIASAYDAKLDQGFGARSFMLARVIRLWPVLALGVAAGLAQALIAPVAGKDLPLGADGRMVCAGFGLGFLPCPILPSEMFPTDPPAWSLFYELVANLLFALAFVPLLKAGRLATVIGAGGAVAASGVLHFHGATFGGGPHGVAFEFGRVGFSFFLGVLMHRTRARWSPHVPRLSPWMIYALLLALLAAPTPRPLQAPVHLFGILIASPLLVALGAQSPARGRLLDISLTAGALSYPLYALHMPLMFLGRGLGADRRVPPALLDLTLAVGIASLAYLVARFYEPLARRWMDAGLKGCSTNRQDKAARPMLTTRTAARSQE